MSSNRHDWRVLNGPPPLNRAQRRQAQRAQRNLQPTPLRRTDQQNVQTTVEHDGHADANALQQAAANAACNKVVIKEPERDTRPKPPKLDPGQYSLWLVALAQLTGSAAAADALVQDARRHGIDDAARQLSYTTAFTFERARNLLQQALDCFPSNCSVN